MTNAQTDELQHINIHADHTQTPNKRLRIITTHTLGKVTLQTFVSFLMYK
jgi:hypothetical protein